MDDVAGVAGVSHQTVSRVLNDSPAVRPVTRERVLAAVAALGYRRNLAARALVTRRSQTLGVISSHTTLHGPASMLRAIERSAREAGYAVSVISEDAVDAPVLRAAVDRLARQAVEGLVVIGPLGGRGDALAGLPRDVPVVVVEGDGGCGLPTVGVDQRGGARQAVRHLLDAGAGSGAGPVWHVAGPAGWGEADARLAGWRAELEDAGLAAPEPLRGDWSPASGYAAGRVLARRDDVGAVFVGNDQMALGVLRALAEAGRAVPEDVLVAGFDDVPEAAYYWPPLTTVRQDFAAVGRRSIQVLLEQLEGSPQREAPLAPAALVVRRSTVRGPAGASVRMPR